MLIRPCRDQGPGRAADPGEDQELSGCREEVRQAKEVIEDLMANRAALAGEVAGLKGLLSGLDEDFSLQEVKAQKAIIIERDRELEAVRQQLHGREEVHLALRREHDRQVEKFEVETANWLSEKEKVIRYQKQLQLNYVSMYKKNKTLEQEMDQLKASLAEGPDRTKSAGGHVSSAKAKLFSKFSSKFGD
jgi:chromosome segregation ATPase